MTSLLLEMLAARTNGNANPAVADLLARMRSSSGRPAELPPELLSQLANNGNPMLGMLAKHLSEAQARPVVIDVESEEVPDALEPPGEKNQDVEESAAAMSELRGHVENMFAELKLLRERIDLLAAALGACCLCWGQDGQCRICRGRGRPGFSMPDEALFDEFVLPAIRTLRAQLATRRLVSPPPQTKTFVEH